MPDLTRRDFLKTGGAAAVLAGIPAAWSPLAAKPRMRWRSQHPTISADPALHLLKRAAFGPTRAELARVRSMGVENWIEEQLHPESIDDQALDDRLAAAYPVLTQSIADLRQRDERVQSSLELYAATIERAIYSKRQLLQVLVDHWSNHFSIYLRDGQCVFTKPWEDRAVIRPYALASFRALLGADAHSPCMLDYLDNLRSTAGAPNENYARELMELHTLGVEGGYSETDVAEVARAFTGWSANRATGEFQFYRRAHDREPKQVLGNSLPGGRGIEDGEEVLDILAADPAASRYVSRRLCQRFVADAPPDEVVEAAAQTFRDSGGDLRAVVRTILLSDAFWASSGQKFRRPYEFVTAAVRALELPAAEGQGLAVWLYQLGQGLFLWPAPNGYPDVAGAWANTDLLLRRWNYGLALAELRIRGAAPPYQTLLQGLGPLTAETLVDFFVDLLLQQAIEPEERAQLIAFLHGDDGPFDIQNPAHRPRAASLVGLILDSPYFQWR